VFPGFGTLVNAVTVLVGASIGLLLGHRLPLRTRWTVTDARGLLLSVALRLLQIKPVPVGNLLPALLVAPLVRLLVVLR
jgi:uncharacterized membrane protein YqgA involved in biofilm formation